jgi:transposase
MTGEVLSGPERRRRWSSEEKTKIIAEAVLPGAKVSEIARRHGISRSLLYTWRREAEHGSASNVVASMLPDLVPVMITDGAEVPKRPALPAERVGAATKGVGTIEIALPGGVRVVVRGRIEERLLRAVLSALRSV